MSNDIPGYDVQDPVPWNPEAGKNLAPGREPVALSFANDLIGDPADPAESNVTDGWVKGIGIGVSGNQ